MHTLSIGKVIQLAQFVVYEQLEPLFIWGQPGGGKTEAMSQLADKNNAYHVDVRLGQYDSVDLRGVPSLHMETKTTRWFKPATLPFRGNPDFESLDQNRIIQLTFDEMNQANQATSGAAYQIINERRIGEHELLPQVRMVAMGNREGDKAIANRQPSALSNRFTHVEVGIDVPEWCMHVQSTGEVPPVGIACHMFKQNVPYLSTFDPKNPQKVFATPRTWVKAFKYYNAGRSEDIVRAAMSGVVGEGPATEFWGFVDIWGKLPSMEDIKKNPMKIKLPDELSLVYATAVAVSGAMNKKDMTPFYKYITRLGEVHPEMVVLCMQLAMRRDKEIHSTPEFIQFATDFKGVFGA